MDDQKKVNLEESMGHRLRMINVGVDKYLYRQFSHGTTLPKGQGPICGYLMTHQDRPVFQKDIERTFHISGATASTSLKNMEANGYIRRIPLPEDGRMKQIVLTDKGRNVHETFICSMNNLEEILLRGFTEEDCELLTSMLDRLTQNIREELSCEETSKEQE